MSDLVFVYGTLKRGQKNHDILDSLNAHYITSAVLPGFVLYASSKCMFPMAVRSDSSSDRISGEVYHIDDDRLGVLDWFEGYDPVYPESSLFIRESFLMEGMFMFVSIYLFNESKLPSDSIRIVEW